MGKSNLFLIVGVIILINFVLVLNGCTQKTSSDESTIIEPEIEIKVEAPVELIQKENKLDKEMTEIDTKNAEDTIPRQFKLNSNSDLFEKIRRQLKEGEHLKLTKKPTFQLPSDIHEAQIDKYYIIGDIFVALVRKTSMNIYLKNLPRNFQTTFSGIIAADSTKKQWEKILTIQDLDLDSYNINNPYFLWIEKGNFLLTIVDQNGAGSGEGCMKLLNTSDLKNWTQKQCYYFGLNFGGPEDRNVDYFQFSATPEGQINEIYCDKSCNSFTLK